MKIYKIAEKTKKNPMEEFSYGEDIKRLWDNLLFMEQDRANIHFNNENNDGYDIKTKNLSFKHNDSEYRVTARICWAGGDWESPICYFTCQFESRMYVKSWGKWRSCCKSIIIPIKSNPNLIKNKDGGMAAKSSEDGQSQKDSNDRALWNEMLVMADDRITKYMSEYLEYDGNMKFENTGCCRNLVDLMTSKREK